MKNYGRIFFSLAILMTSFRSWAGLYPELALFTVSDSFTASTSSTDSSQFFAFDLLAGLDNKSRFYAGFRVHQLSFSSESSTATETFSTQDMGPFLLWAIDDKKIFSLSAGFSVIASGLYSNGTSDSELSGSGYFASFGVMPEISDDWYLGVRLNYVASNYDREVIGSTSSAVGYSRTFLFPSINFTYRK